MSEEEKAITGDTKTNVWVAEEDGFITNATLDELVEDFPDLGPTFASFAETHGEVVVCRTRAGVACFRRPKGAEYDRFLGGLLDDRKESKVKAANILARNCVLHPNKTIFGAWLDEYPGIPSAVTKPLNKLMGGELQARGKE